MFGRQFERAGRRLAQQANTVSRCKPGHWTGRLETAPLRPQRRAYSASGEAASAGQPNGAGSLFRKAATYAAVGAAFSAIGAAAAWKALTAHGLGFYSDEESLLRFNASEVDDEARRVEETINSHPLVVELRSRPELTESRPHMKMPAQYSGRSLTGGALVGPGKVPVPAFCWTEAGGKSFVSVVYVGDNLCGHPGIIHGGFLATMLDEGLAWCCFGALPHNIGVTAFLNINYRKPAPAGSFLVLRAETTKVEGRKAWVKGHIELLAEPGEKPTVLTEAEALYVSPKYAAMMPRIH
ncbi:hypothetical protein PLIIFM63780_006937 [Purpureocillium lilacinum]|uniref:Uncharacterized protein n=1 Tax=Purpureocillium lilacinum TaxID=33203 RepID=A0ACC4E1J9_PURLI|nr:hypothetical protein PLIIFM63780_006937 [Purpureocillium lilacinum]